MVRISDHTGQNCIPFYQVHIGDPFKILTDSDSCYLYIKADASHAFAFTEKPSLIPISSSKKVLVVSIDIVIKPQDI